jgi:hypothetical protein
VSGHALVLGMKTVDVAQALGKACMLVHRQPGVCGKGGEGEREDRGP